ncbi:DUF4932 domain-containing protein [Psychroserpens ponticola]|uniref:DUF4932 domain-containing protein n=1 Tax=Psychroserpens ponticola TaxID=2932268 RepID=A0ABY7RVV7_9FLAO|nr:DUF4932 domain-containing protein [Psychroserpens ponticola]WCO01069.1 DUF4932 domain-containing protein [Psychroserpens ponticola]
MRKIIGVFFILITLSGCSQKKKNISEQKEKTQKEAILKEPKVDKRVELLSIVFRLAGCHEYSQNLFPEYVESIENHFEKFKNHDLITYVKDELREDGIGFSAVMSMAIHITEPPNIKPIITPFSNTSLEEPWREDSAIKFLKLLNIFYTDADCETFFNSNKELYKTASNRFKNVYQNLDLEWYQNFYGAKPKGEFRIINGLGNGGASYGPHIMYPNGNEVVYAIMGTWSVDSLGMPNYEMKEYFPTILHEFNHSFINHLVEKYRSQLQESGTIIFNKVKDEMNKQAYGNWKTMYDEALVRATVIKYMKDHNYDRRSIEKELDEQLNSSFLWTDALVKELERYDNNRDSYPTLEHFMTELVIFFNNTASEIDLLKKISVATKEKTIRE